MYCISEETGDKFVLCQEQKKFLWKIKTKIKHGNDNNQWNGKNIKFDILISNECIYHFIGQLEALI